MSEHRLSRRDLLTFWRRKESDAPAPRHPLVPEEPEAPPPFKHRLPLELRAPLRPPGAVGEQALADVCSRCNKCMEVCPVHAIVPAPPEYGPWAGTPRIVAREISCILCEGLLCTTVCPTGALTPVSQPQEVSMGKAYIDWQICLGFTRPPCTVCHVACPIDNVIIFDNHDHPRVQYDLCTGCGACEKACPTERPAIVVTPHGRP